MTAARSGEGGLADWNEIDLNADTCTVPASGMKARREQRVSLGEAVLDVLEAARRWKRIKSRLAGNQAAEFGTGVLGGEPPVNGSPSRVLL